MATPQQALAEVVGGISINLKNKGAVVKLELKVGVLLVGLAVSGGVFAGSAGTFAAVFSPATVPLNGSATLTYTMTAFDNSRRLSFNTTLPAGVVVASPNGASTDCGSTPAPVLAPTITAIPGGTSVQFADANTTTVYDGPFSGARSYGCIMSVKVEGTAVGSHLVPATLFDNGGATGLTAPATLTVTAAMAAAASIPTLSEWGLILLVLAMAASGFKATRRRR